MVDIYKINFLWVAHLPIPSHNSTMDPGIGMIQKQDNGAAISFYWLFKEFENEQSELGFYVYTPNQNFMTHFTNISTYKWQISR